MKQSTTKLLLLVFALLVTTVSCKKVKINNYYYVNNETTTKIFNYTDTIIVSQKSMPVEFSAVVNLIKNSVSNEIGINAILKSAVPPYGWNIKYTLYDDKYDKKISEHEYTKIKTSEVTFKVLGFPSKKDGREYELKIEVKPYGSNSVEKQNTFKFQIKN